MASGKKEEYSGLGRLMPNYGWVQNTSNLSTIRDTVELVPVEGINHNALMKAIYEYRSSRGEIRKKWSWDARCRIKAICACGLVELDRNLRGYRLTDLGMDLRNSTKSSNYSRNIRLLSDDEKEIFRKGLLTNPPVVRVLSILNENRRSGQGPMTKYDVGSKLGFVGDIGFTHFEAEYVVRSGKSFNDAEGDADKWARTIISWLCQVDWVVKDGNKRILGKTIPVFTTTNEVDRVLQYSARSAIKYIPQEMLCSDHHPFASIVKQRRVAILKILKNKGVFLIEDLVNEMKKQGIEIDKETIEFDILNLNQAGIQIMKVGSNYRLVDSIKIDEIADRVSIGERQNINEVEKQIEHLVTIYEDSLPPRLVDNLIRYGSDGRNSSTLFEVTVEKLFSFMGYESKCLGQGHGRVADVIVEYHDPLYPKSYGFIIDSKAYSQYSFPADDVRKMKEYINTHGLELLHDAIPRHAFAFVSMSFTSPDEHLEEIARDTAVQGTAIDVFSLLELASKVAKKEVSIADLFSRFTTNRIFK